MIYVKRCSRGGYVSNPDYMLPQLLINVEYELLYLANCGITERYWHMSTIRLTTLMQSQRLNSTAQLHK